MSSSSCLLNHQMGVVPDRLESLKYAGTPSCLSDDSSLKNGVVLGGFPTTSLDTLAQVNIAGREEGGFCEKLRAEKRLFYEKLRAEHEYLHVFCCDCGKQYTVPKSCGNRLCPVCTSRRRRALKAYLWRKWELPRVCHSRRFRWRFITLTYKNQKDLSAALDKIQLFFKRLRRHEGFKNKVVGGIGSIEVTKSKMGWHVHVHIIAEGKYFPQAALSDEWKVATAGLGYITYITMVDERNIKKSIKELAKYITDPYLASFLSARDVNELRVSLHRRRLLYKFGGWYGEKITVSSRGSCKYCGGSALIVLEFEPLADDIYIGYQRYKSGGYG